MQPNQNQYSIDYLNQIAPTAKKPGLSNKLFLGIVAGGILLAIVVGFSLINGGQTNTQQLETLTARLQTLQKVSTASQRNIKSGLLRNTNSNLSIFLTNADRDIAGPIKNSGVDIKNIDKNITVAENGTALTAKLEDARLSATFDRTYAREMNYQLATVTNLMKQIYTHTNSKSFKQFIDETNKNLQPISQQLESFTGSGV